MTLADFLHPSAILPCLKVKDHRNLLHILSEHASQLVNLDTDYIYKQVMLREKQGGTLIGSGVAIPHARLDNLQNSLIIFAHLSSAIRFSAQDLEAVDLVFFLLSPKHAVAQHLSVLAKIARYVRNDNLLLPLRNMKTADEMYNLLCCNKMIDNAL